MAYIDNNIGLKAPIMTFLGVTFLLAIIGK